MNVNNVPLANGSPAVDEDLAGVVRTPYYKVCDLFGNEQTVFIKNKSSKPNLFSDYDAFLAKFEPKKTTDDCYTPKEVMDIVINYVNEKYPLAGKNIVRPFYPGGDYESIEYTDDMVVIDNPPFSIITKICRFYLAKKVKFFLFCPHLTAFGADIDCTHIIASADITYENGATIKTSFVSNLFGDAKIIGDADLHQRFKKLQGNKPKLPKYEYPEHVITVSKVTHCVERGISVVFDKKDVKHYRQLDAQKRHGKALFGSGFLASDKAAANLAAALAAANLAAALEAAKLAAADLAAAKLEAAKLAAAKLEAAKLAAAKLAAAKLEAAKLAAADLAAALEAAKLAAAKKDGVIVWELSEREKAIVKSLGVD